MHKHTQKEMPTREHTFREMNLFLKRIFEIVVCSNFVIDVCACTHRLGTQPPQEHHGLEALSDEEFHCPLKMFTETPGSSDMINWNMGM